MPNKEMSKKVCVCCGSDLPKRKRKYCSTWCAYLQKDKEKHLPPLYKRNKNYFHMVNGVFSGYSRRQGKRNGSMVTGSMSVREEYYTYAVEKFNLKNIESHLEECDKHGEIPHYIEFGNKEIVFFGDN